MSAQSVIAVDAMGGDHAPGSVIEGTAAAAMRLPGANYIFFGEQPLIEPLLGKHPHLKSRSVIRHTAEKISSDLKPSQALRQGRNSSMRLALDAVAAGEAQCAVSAGNTGALMALAKLTLKTLPNIDRPALAATMPTSKGECLMLDLGANVQCDAENLVQFALMGTLLARTVLGVQNPLVGILNVGTEEMKGHEEIRTALNILRERPFPGRLHGFVEGSDINAGTVDVIVTDGFSGNVALKTVEGTAKLINHFLRESLRASLMNKIGAWLARDAFVSVKNKLDPRRYNGAMLLGLQGLCVKSHGGADAEGFSSAVSLAIDLVQQDYVAHVRQELARHYGEAPVAEVV